MDQGNRRYTLRIDASLLDKIHYIAKYEGRSVNKEIEQMIKHRIVAFEKANGKIADAVPSK